MGGARMPNKRALRLTMHDETKAELIAGKIHLRMKVAELEGKMKTLQRDNEMLRELLNTRRHRQVPAPKINHQQLTGMVQW